MVRITSFFKIIIRIPSRNIVVDQATGYFVVVTDALISQTTLEHVSSEVVQKSVAFFDGLYKRPRRKTDRSRSIKG